MCNIPALHLHYSGFCSALHRVFSGYAPAGNRNCVRSGGAACGSIAKTGRGPENRAAVNQTSWSQSMRLNSQKFVPIILFVLVVLAGCAGKGKIETASPMGSGGSMISIEASNHKFSPREIRLEKPGLLAVEIRNVSGSQHNFTLKDPRGKVLKTVDIRPAGSVIINVELSDPGVYRFYCNKTFHTFLGMKGRIIVGR